MAMRPNLLRTGLLLLWCAQSAHVHAAKGWLHAQFTHDRASLSQMHQGFDDMDLDGKGVIPFWGQFRTRTGSSRTLTITAELRPGTYQLTRLKNIHTVDLGIIKQVFALTSDFPDLPPLVIEAGKVLPGERSRILGRFDS